MGKITAATSVVKVVVIVPVTVADATKVVSTRSVPMVVITVVPTDDVGLMVPSEVIVVLRTVIAVMTAVVSMGIVTTAWVVTTVSKVVSGNVRVSVTLLGTAVAVAFPKGALLSSGDSVADDTATSPVGNGCTAGCPAVSSVVITDLER